MRFRPIALFSAVALVALGSVPVSAGENEDSSYLALGDSVAFGTNPLVDPRDAENFTGYPETVAERLDIDHTNASCPGEATGGFISLQGLDNVCRPYRAAFPLHVDYTGTQLSFAVAYLNAHPRTKLVTLNLDANDAFRLGQGPVSPPPSGCYTPDVVVYFNTCAVQNLRTIFAAIRATGYEGLIVALTYYALRYPDVTGAPLLNGAMIAAAAQSDHVLVASGYDAWNSTAMAAGGSSCAAGLLIMLPTGTCDIHPSPAGRDLLAGAILQTIANSCPLHSATGCLSVNRD